MTSAYAKYLDTYARAMKGDKEAVTNLYAAGRAAVDELRASFDMGKTVDELRAALKENGHG